MRSRGGKRSPARWLATCLLALLAAGCHAGRPGGAGTWLPPFPNLPTRSGAETFAPVAQAPTVAIPGAPAATPPASGRIRVYIKWPDQDRPGFRAQLIPTSTRAMTITVSNGTYVRSETVARPEGGGVQAIGLPAPAGDNLSLIVRAYRDKEPHVGSTVIAEGSAAGINVRQGLQTDVPIKLVPVFSPAIWSLGSNAGAPGDLLAINGTNLSASTTVTFCSTTPGASVSVPVESAAANSIWAEVRIPETAATGRIVVEADGIKTDSQAVFWVYKSLEADTGPLPWFVQQNVATFNDPGYPLLVGGTHTFALQAALVKAPADTSDYGPPPEPQVRISDQEAGTLAATESASCPAPECFAYAFAAADRRATPAITFTLGDMTAVVNFAIEDVAELRIVVPITEFGYLWATAPSEVTAIQVMTDGSTNSAVAFESSDPATLSVAPVCDACRGRAVVTPNLESWGDIELAAVSALLPSRRATQALKVRNYVVSPLAGSAANRGTAVDGTGSGARFGCIGGIAVDAFGWVFVTEGCASGGFQGVRAISPVGGVRTIAAGFSTPAGIAATEDGVIVADTGNHVIRRVAYDRSAASGKVSTVAGMLGLPGFGTGLATKALLHFPTAIAAAPGGTYYILERETGGQSWEGRLLALNAGNLVTKASSASILPNGGATIKFASRALAVTPLGRGWLADPFRILKMSDSGILEIFAGDTAGYADGSGAKARFAEPASFAVDAGGDVFIYDATNAVIQRLQESSSPDTPRERGTVRTIAGRAGQGAATGFTAGLARTMRLPTSQDGGLHLAVGPDGTIYVAGSGEVAKIVPKP